MIFPFVKRSTYMETVRALTITRYNLIAANLLLASAETRNQALIAQLAAMEQDLCVLTKPATFPKPKKDKDGKKTRKA